MIALLILMALVVVAMWLVSMRRRKVARAKARGYLVARIWEVV